MIFYSFIRPDDEVVFFEPYFQYFEYNAKLSGARIRVSGLKVENGCWTIDFEHFESIINEKTRLLILNSPHNPTGKVFQEWELRKIAKIVEKYKDLIVISDEVYEKCVYENDGNLVRFASLDKMWDKTITILSAGKVINHLIYYIYF